MVFGGGWNSQRGLGTFSTASQAVEFFLSMLCHLAISNNANNFM